VTEYEGVRPGGLVGAAQTETSVTVTGGRVTVGPTTVTVLMMVIVLAGMTLVTVLPAWVIVIVLAGMTEVVVVVKVLPGRVVIEPGSVCVIVVT
jgi:hypothetical protein